MILSYSAILAIDASYSLMQFLILCMIHCSSIFKFNTEVVAFTVYFFDIQYTWHSPCMFFFLIKWGQLLSSLVWIVSVYRLIFYFKPSGCFKSQFTESSKQDKSSFCHLKNGFVSFFHFNLWLCITEASSSSSGFNPLSGPDSFKTSFWFCSLKTALFCQYFFVFFL